MRIGLDLDGVVIDSEKTFKVYGEIYACEVLHKKLVNPEEPKHRERYNLNKEEADAFVYEYILKAAKESPLMAGFIPVFNKLKEQGHEFIVITARGGILPEMKEDALRVIKENNLQFDKCYFNCQDKLKVCLDENIDIMIDDDYRIIEELSKSNIKTLYFRDTNIKKLDENNYIHEVNNWGDIYRYFYELDKKNKA